MAERAPRKAAKKAGRAKAPKKAAAKPRKAAKPAKSAKKGAGKGAPSKRKSAKRAAAATATEPAKPATEDAWVFVSDEDQVEADPWLAAAGPEPEVEAATGETWEFVDDGPEPATQTEPDAWAPPPAAPAAQAPLTQPAKTFDPSTGEWLAAEAPQQLAPAEVVEAPEARRRGAIPTVATILLGLDLAFLAFNVLAALFAGIVLVFLPDSGLAEEFRESVRIDSPAALAAETLLMLALFGLIPLLWVVATRRDPKEGTKRYLRLHSPRKGILLGVALTVPLLLAVMALTVGWTLATEGPDGLTNPDEDANPAVQGIVDNLSWPLVLLIALSAGIGEEIFFRGLLQRWVGVWGQAVLFGLAHAAGGYIPQVVFALGLGVLFGYLVKRGWSLWTMITAHVLYDLTLLAIAMASKAG